MTINEVLSLLNTAQRDGRLLIRDSDNRVHKPVASVSIRIDDDGQMFIILHDDRCAEIDPVKRASE